MKTHQDIDAIADAEALAEHNALVKVAKAADQLETLLRNNAGRNDDWPIAILVCGDYAQRLANKLTVLSRALKPYRQKIK